VSTSVGVDCVHSVAYVEYVIRRDRDTRRGTKCIMEVVMQVIGGKDLTAETIADDYPELWSIILAKSYDN